jgi:hypothetical protein
MISSAQITRNESEKKNGKSVGFGWLVVHSATHHTTSPSFIKPTPKKGKREKKKE